MVFMIWPVLLPVAAQLAQSVVSGFNNRAMNRYNSPKKQLSRLRAAGLPFAAFTAGQAGNQSTLPDVSGIGAAGDTLSKYFGSRNDQVDYRVKKNLADISDEDTKALFDNSYGPAEAPTNPIRIKRQLEAIQNLYDMDNSSNRRLMEEMDKEFRLGNYNDGTMKKRYDAETEKILLGNRLGEQLFKNTEILTAARNELIGRMQKDGLSFMEALLITVLSSVSGSMNADGSGGIKF